MSATMESNLVEVGKVGELQDGAMKPVNVKGSDIFIARAGDKYYAAARWCPHMGGDLSQGKLQGTVVTCPRHFSQFDLTDGHVVRWTNSTGLMLAAAKFVRSPRPVKTYTVRIHDDRILIEI